MLSPEAAAVELQRVRQAAERERRERREAAERRLERMRRQPAAAVDAGAGAPLRAPYARPARNASYRA